MINHVILYITIYVYIHIYIFFFAALCYSKEVKNVLLSCFLTSESQSDTESTPNIVCQSNPGGILNGVAGVHYQLLRAV